MPRRSDDRKLRTLSCMVMALLVLAVTACTGNRPAPSMIDGRVNVVGPDAGFVPPRSQSDWFALPKAASGFVAAELSDVLVLQIAPPGGAVIGRRMDMALLAAPNLRWSWYLNPMLYGGGPADGLPRGLRLVIGFKGGTAGGPQLTDRLFGVVSGGYPAHDRAVELVLGGIGTLRAENAQVELMAMNDRGIRRVIRPPAFGQTGKWHVEAIDLADIYAGFWPRDRMAEVVISFIAVGGLPGRLPAGLEGQPTIGYVGEMLLTR